MSEFPKPSENLNNAPLLRDVLASIHFTKGRAAPTDLTQVNLGVFSDEARQLANACFLDASGSNFAKFIYATSSDKVFVPNSLYKSVDGQAGVFAIAHIPHLPKSEAQNNPDGKYPAMIIQTSSNMDQITSLNAYALLLASDSERISLSAVLVAGMSKNFVTFRGKNTPQLTIQELEGKPNLWHSQIQKRFNQHIKPNTSLEEARDLYIRIENALFKQIVRTYDLKYFVGESDQNIVEKQEL